MVDTDFWIKSKNIKNIYKYIYGLTNYKSYSENLWKIDIFSVKTCWYYFIFLNLFSIIYTISGFFVAYFDRTFYNLVLHLVLFSLLLIIFITLNIYLEKEMQNKIIKSSIKICYKKPWYAKVRSQTNALICY